MKSTRTKFTAFVFTLLLVLSGLSFGFLVRQSQAANADATLPTATEQLEQVTTKVSTGAAMVNRGVELVQRVLVK